LVVGLTPRQTGRLTVGRNATRFDFFLEMSSEPQDTQPSNQQLLPSKANASVCLYRCDEGSSSTETREEQKSSDRVSPYAVTYKGEEKKKGGSLRVTAICRQFPKLRRFFRRGVREGGDERGWVGFLTLSLLLCDIS
jgi:hypothetical protein